MRGGNQVIHFYLASSKTGTMAFEVLGPASAKSYVGAYIAALADSVQVEPQDEAPAPDLVTLTPAPGVTMSVPKGWIACGDAAVNALLGNTPDPDNVGPRACVGASAHQKLMLFDPHRFHYSDMKVSYFTDKIDAGRFADLITPDALAKRQPKECADITKPLVDNGGTVLSCVESAGTLAGRPAKIVTIVTSEETQPGVPNLQFQNTLTDVPYGQGIVEFQTITAVMLKPITQPPLDAMMNSVVIP